MSLIANNLKIRRGATFSYAMRWGQGPLVYKAITGATQGGPLRLTVTGHGIVPETWPIAIANVLGMTRINAKARPPEPEDYVIATVDDANHLLVNSINSAGFAAYVSGGTIQYPTPADLSGYSARMQIRSSIDSADVLLSLTDVNTRIVLDATNAMITLVLTAVETAALDWLTGVYDLELVSGSGEVTSFAQGTVTVSKEVTR